jgi:hypothetical protein
LPDSLPFLPGYPPEPNRLLARFLPPLAEGVTLRYLERYSRPGDLVFDPFGQSPRIAVEALFLGQRIVVANFNPVSRLVLSLEIAPPSESELRSALTLLADLPKDGDRLENYLRALYRSTCPDCDAEVFVDAFEWEVGEGALREAEPVEKIYLCPNCGGPPKLRPTDDADRALAARFPAHSLDYHFLLDRVARADDPDRAQAEEALAIYPPRALAAIATVLVKLEALNPPADTRRLLCGLLVAAFDASCALSQERPKILMTSKRYRENNFFLELEKATGMLAGVPAPDRTQALRDLLTPAANPGIHVQAGPARDLAPLLPEGSCSLVISAIPRPNQAYWTLSALWSAWLWGREAAASLRSVLHRRRYDWAWHAEALQATFTSLRPALAPGRKMVGLAAEAEPGFNAAIFAAADRAGYTLHGAAFCADTPEAQFIWENNQTPGLLKNLSVSNLELEAAIRETARHFALGTILDRGEPSRWSSVHFCAWRGLAQEHLLAAIPDEPLAFVNHQLESVFHDPTYFQRLDSTPSDDSFAGLWYLKNEAALYALPLADRVEAEVLFQLYSSKAVDEQHAMQTVNETFPGPETPGRNLVMACFNSYAVKNEAGLWQLREEDASLARLEELQAVQSEIRSLAIRLGYSVAGANPQEWREAGQTVYLFAATTSAFISDYLFEPLLPAHRRFLVLPGGRGSLAAFKLRRDPRLRAALRRGNWVILKFRHIRQMAEDLQLTRATLEPAFYADPVEEVKQLELMGEEEGE